MRKLLYVLICIATLFQNIHANVTQAKESGTTRYIAVRKDLGRAQESYAVDKAEAQAIASLKSIGATAESRRFGLVFLVDNQNAKEALTIVGNEYYTHVDLEVKTLEGMTPPNDPEAAVQWNLSYATDWFDVWQYQQLFTNTVKVAVLDTGIISPTALVDENGEPYTRTHRDAINYTGGYDTVSADLSGDGDGADEDPTQTSFELCDKPLSHHEEVRSTISARTNNRNGISGTARNVEFLDVRVLNACGNGYMSDTLDGVLWAAQLGKAKVINLSLGSYSKCFKAAQNIFDQVYKMGVTVVAAAGNSGKYGGAMPANCNHVIAVSAINQEGDLAWFSNHAGQDGWSDEVMTVAAPGQNLYTLCFNSKYEESVCRASGTSFSSPMVAALAAIYYSANEATPDDFYSFMLRNLSKFHSGSNCVNYPELPSDSKKNCGYGMLNFKHSILELVQPHMTRQTFVPMFMSSADQEIVIEATQGSEMVGLWSNPKIEPIIMGCERLGSARNFNGKWNGFDCISYDGQNKVDYYQETSYITDTVDGRGHVWIYNPVVWPATTQTTTLSFNTWITATNAVTLSFETVPNCQSTFTQTLIAGDTVLSDTATASDLIDPTGEPSWQVVSATVPLNYTGYVTYDLSIAIANSCVEFVDALRVSVE